MNFKEASILSNYLSKDYAERIFSLLMSYKNISASEAASRLSLHIRTVQDFLETMTLFEILEKEEVYEGKRPYFRYSLKKKKIELVIDLNEEFSKENQIEQAIREKSNAQVKFSLARGGEYFSTVSLWTGKGRNLSERRISLTIAQGKFLYHLPFPDAKPLVISEIMKKSGVKKEHQSEINNLINELIALDVIDVYS